ncbi:MAG TPA: hypothetical protein VFY61_09140 [Pyrinomonadaceae bacterium]|nr:hypothetical protein [Pyrinomonadaceae bacterium]
MSIDKNKITTQDELNEPAPMDQADERAKAEMRELERKAKQAVAEGLQQTDEEDETGEKDDEKPAPSMLDRRR